MSLSQGSRRQLPPVHSVLEGPFNLSVLPIPSKESMKTFAEEGSRGDVLQGPSYLREVELAIQEKWSCWVVVYGYDVKEVEAVRGTKSSVVSLLFDMLVPYGDILEYAQGNGNWTFFRYTITSWISSSHL